MEDGTTQTIELKLREGVTPSEAFHIVGNGLVSSQNSVWNYRYPTRVGSMDGPWMHRMPLTFALKSGTSFTNLRSIRDIGFTQNTNILSSPTYLTVMGADTSDRYQMWKASGGSALTHATGAPFTVVNNPYRPGCSVYWETPGYNPREAVTSSVPMTFVASAKTITRGSGDFTANGFRVGDSVIITGTTNNNATVTIAAITTTVITTTEALVDEGPVTCTLTLNPVLTHGVLIYSHSEGNKIYYLQNNLSTIYDLTSAVTNCPEGASAMTLHLDRLWMGKAFSSYSLITYTNPNDLATIFPENIIRIPGQVSCLIPGQFGAVDSTGIPHLIIGTYEGILVIDGDPIVNGGLQASLRILSASVGIPNPNAACTTQYGTFILGNDAQLWLIPPGCQTMVAVGDPIQNNLGNDEADNAYPIGSLAWLDPYLYIYPRGETARCFIAEPTGRSIKFWGPVTMASSVTSRLAIVKTPAVPSLYSVSGSTGAHPIYSADVLPTSGTNRILGFDEYCQPTGTYPDGTSLNRTARVISGSINIPGHLVQIRRVTVEYTRPPNTSGGTTPALDVSVSNMQGVSRQGYRYEPASPAGTFLRAYVDVGHYTISNPFPHATGLLVNIAQTAEANLAILRVLVDIHVVKAKF